jgi:hypothetical protein
MLCGCSLLVLMATCRPARMVFFFLAFCGGITSPVLIFCSLLVHF